MPFNQDSVAGLEHPYRRIQDLTKAIQALVRIWPESG
jgi:hypothetical protein